MMQRFKCILVQISPKNYAFDTYIAEHVVSVDIHDINEGTYIDIKYYKGARQCRHIMPYKDIVSIDLEEE